MKRMKKHMITLLTVMLMTAGFAVSIQAAPKVPKSQTHYMKPTPWTKTGETSGSIDVKGMGKSQKIIKSSVKSSNKSCVKIGYISSDSISYTAKKPGKAVISFKIDSKKYQTKIYVKKYQNPAKSVVITGVKNGSRTNLASLTNKNTSSKQLHLKKTVKNPKVQVTARKGWKIQQIYYLNGGLADWESGTKNYKKPVSKTTLKIFTKSNRMKTNVGGNRIIITFLNTKSGDTVGVSYNIDVQPHSEMIS